MHIQNNFSPSFQKVHIQSSEMNNRQRDFSYRLLDDLQYSDEYSCADSQDIDLYILPNEKVKDGVVVKFVDNYSDQFFRSKNGRVVTCKYDTQQRGLANLFKFSDTIKTKLRDIMSGKYERPDFDPEKIIKAQTDVALIDPEIYDDIIEDIELYDSLGVSRLAAEEISAETFISEKLKTNKDSEF